MNKWLKRFLIVLFIAGCYGGYRYYQHRDYEAKQAMLQQFAVEADKKEKIENEKKEEQKRIEEEEKKRLADEKAKAEAEDKAKVKPVPIDKCYIYDSSVDDARNLPPIHNDVIELFKEIIWNKDIVVLGKSELYDSPGIWRVKVSPNKKGAEYYVLRFFNELPYHHREEFYDVYSIKRKNERLICIDITVEGKTGKITGYHIQRFELDKDTGIDGKYTTIEKVVY